MLRDYLPVLLQIIVVVLFAVSALLVSVLVGKHGKRTRAKDTAYECGMIPEGERQPRFSVKFYIVAMLFILFDLEIVFMYPCAVVYRDAIKQSSVIFWSMLSFITLLMVEYVYALNKGALDFKKYSAAFDFHCGCPASSAHVGVERAAWGVYHNGRKADFCSGGAGRCLRFTGGTFFAR